jgi:hypothetical protein
MTESVKRLTVYPDHTGMIFDGPTAAWTTELFRQHANYLAISSRPGARRGRPAGCLPLAALIIDLS